MCWNNWLEDFLSVKSRLECGFSKLIQRGLTCDGSLAHTACTSPVSVVILIVLADFVI